MGTLSSSLILFSGRQRRTSSNVFSQLKSTKNVSTSRRRPSEALPIVPIASSPSHKSRLNRNILALVLLRPPLHGGIASLAAVILPLSMFLFFTMRSTKLRERLMRPLTSVYGWCLRHCLGKCDRYFAYCIHYPHRRKWMSAVSHFFPFPSSNSEKENIPVVNLVSVACM